MIFGGIRRRIFLMAVVILVPLIGSSIILVAYFAQARFQSEQIAMSANTQALAAAVDSQVKRHVAIGESLQAFWTTTDRNLERLYNIAKDAMDLVPESWLIVVDADGQQLLNTKAKFGDPLPKMTPSAAQAKAIETGRWQLSDIFLEPLTSMKVAGVYVALDSAAKDQRAILVIVNPAILGGIMQDNHLPDGWLNGVIDHDGRFVARNVDHDRLLGTQASKGWRAAAATGKDHFFETVSIEGARVLTYTMRLPQSGWSVAVGADRAVLWAPVSRSIWGIGGIALVLTALSGIMAFLLGRKITTPILELKAATSRLAEPDLAPPEVRRTGISEVDNLLEAYRNSSIQLAERDRRQRLLLGELTHRVKNIITVIQAIAKLSANTAESLPKYVQDFEQRLVGISRTHDILVRESWTGASLRDLIQSELSLYAERSEGRVDFDGPDLRMSPNMTWSLCLVLHELATNAAKYGALAGADGRLSVVWSDYQSGGERRLKLNWQEIGGPPASAPKQTGFGFKLIKQIVERELYGSVDFQFALQGLVVSLDIRVLEDLEPNRQPA